MAKKVYNMQGGKHSAAALSAFLNAMYGSSVASGLNGVITGTTGLNTIVKAGAGNINDSGVGRMIEIDADETVSHAAASPSNPRYDLVVAYIDKGVTPTTSVTDNTNNILKFKSVTGNPSSNPIDPIASEIQASVGASNPYMILYRVRIEANATSLTQDKITDLRKLVSPPLTSSMIADSAITTAKIATASVTGPKIDFASIVSAQLDASSLSLSGKTLKIQTGWSQIVGTGASLYNKAITFPTAFSNACITVLICSLGYKTPLNTLATSIYEFNTPAQNSPSFQALSITASGFSASMYAPGAGAAYHGFSWIAIGY